LLTFLLPIDTEIHWAISIREKTYYLTKRFSNVIAYHT